MGKKHVYYFDFLRLMSALGVIYMHVASGPLRKTVDLNWQGMNVITSFAFTAVPLFIMMSGYLLLRDEKTADVSLLMKKRLPRLVLPLAVWTVVAVLWRLTFQSSFTLRGLYEGLVSSIQTPAWVHFWYMYALIALYLLSPMIYAALKSLDKKGHILLFSILCILNIRTMLNTILPQSWRVFSSDYVFGQFSFMNGILAEFLLGYYLGNLKKRIPNGLLIGVAVAVFATIVGGTYFLTQESGQYNASFQNQRSGFEVLLASCVFLFFKQNCNKNCRFFRRVPVLPLSMSIYLMHNILLATMQMKIRIITFWDTIYVTVLNYLICFVVMKTVSTIKPLCYIATGIPYKTACETCNWIYTYRKLFEK